MSDAAGGGRAAELAREFDRGFAEPAHLFAAEVEDLLAIQAGGDAYAVRVRDIAGLIADRKIVPLPTSDPALLGLAGLRGGGVPVYGLAALLGRAATGATPRWVLLVGRDAPVGLAFDQFEGHVRIARTEMSSGAEEPTGPASARIGGAWREIVGIGALVERIRKRTPEAGTNGGKER